MTFIRSQRRPGALRRSSPRRSLLIQEIISIIRTYYSPCCPRVSSQSARDALLRYESVCCTILNSLTLRFNYPYCKFYSCTTITIRSLPHAHYKNQAPTMRFVTALAVVLLGSSVQALPVTDPAVR